MERIAKFGKETALGGAILLWVLGAPSAAYAAPEIFSGTFTEGCIDNRNTHSNIELEFTGHDSNRAVSCCNVFTGVAKVTGMPTSFHCGTISTPEDFCFESCVPLKHGGDTWDLSLTGYRFCCTGSFMSPFCGGNTFTSGTFTFTPDSPCAVDKCSDFALKNIDFIQVSAGDIATFTQPAVGGAPEVDASALENPLALALATLLALSDPRRKKPDA